MEVDAEQRHRRHEKTGEPGAGLRQNEGGGEEQGQPGEDGDDRIQPGQGHSGGTAREQDDEEPGDGDDAEPVTGDGHEGGGGGQRPRGSTQEDRAVAPKSLEQVGDPVDVGQLSERPGTLGHERREQDQGACTKRDADGPGQSMTAMPLRPGHHHQRHRRDDQESRLLGQAGQDREDDETDGAPRDAGTVGQGIECHGQEKQLQGKRQGTEPIVEIEDGDEGRMKEGHGQEPSRRTPDEARADAEEGPHGGDPQPGQDQLVAERFEPEEPKENPPEEGWKRPIVAEEVFGRVERRQRVGV
ncbi:MAG: hypothetical protein FD129_1208 [bacterium]|nr:MAG: hypothetical protein FD129_1208 [bacterium]